MYSGSSGKRREPRHVDAEEDLMELETKRILLELLKEKQLKSQEAGTIPSFYKKAWTPLHCILLLCLVYVLAGLYTSIGKQSDLLLNGDDLAAMLTNYEDFCHISSVCTEQIGPRCRRFFSPSYFMKIEKDEAGRIAILPFYLYVMRTVSLTQAKMDMSELDQGTDGFLQSHEMEAYIGDLIPNFAQLRDMDPNFIPTYCRIASQKFFFFCDPHRRGTNGIASDLFVALDKDMSKSLSKQELKEYADGALTDIFIERVFDEHVRRVKSRTGHSREMDFDSFLDFVLALENKDTPVGLTYLFRCLDFQGRGFLTTADIHPLFRDVHEKWIEGGNYELCIEDVWDEIWDMVKPSDPLKITLSDLLGCKQGGTVASMLIDVRSFWAHDNRENLLQEEEEEQPPEEESL
ncbi:unnamed protein product [Cochlearia groenlandica]